jgi:hypothetical protein
VREEMREFAGGQRAEIASPDRDELDGMGSGVGSRELDGERGASQSVYVLGRCAGRYTYDVNVRKGIARD